MPEHLPEEEIKRIREALRPMVREEFRDALASLPILTKEPTEAGVKGWIKRNAPKSVAGYCVVLYFLGKGLVAVCATGDKLYHSYEDAKPFVASTEAHIQVWEATEYESGSSQKPLPRPSPLPWNPIAAIANAYGSNTASSGIHFFSLRSGFGVTGGQSIDLESGDGTIKPKV